VWIIVRAVAPFGPNWRRRRVKQSVFWKWLTSPYPTPCPPSNQSRPRYCKCITLIILICKSVFIIYSYNVCVSLYSVLIYNRFKFKTMMSTINSYIICHAINKGLSARLVKNAILCTCAPHFNLGLAYCCKFSIYNKYILIIFYSILKNIFYI